MLNKIGIYQICFIVIFFGATCLTSYAKDEKDESELVFGFCYALQASMICKDLKMRIDTERKIEKQVGKKIRGPKSPYNDDCMAGLNEAFEDENKGLCKNAWKKYGCEGTEVPKLLFKTDGSIYCVYE